MAKEKDIKSLTIKTTYAIFISDIHFGVRQNSEEWQENQKSYFYDWFLPMIKAFVQSLKENEKAVLIGLGDIFDDRKSIDINVNNLAIDIFEDIAEVLPVYIITLKLHLLDSVNNIMGYLGLVMPFAVSAFGIFLMRQAFLGIPREMEEAAIVDGCNVFQVFWKVLLPMVKPSLAVLAIFTFIGSWGEFLWPSIVLTKESLYTLPVGVNNLQGMFSSNWRYIAAAAAAGIVLALTLVWGSGYEGFRLPELPEDRPTVSDGLRKWNESLDSAMSGVNDFFDGLGRQAPPEQGGN